MEMTRKRRLQDILSGFFLLCHPGPVFFHILAVTLFTLLASWPHLIWSTIILIIAAHTAMQLSIAILNDYFDREHDRVSQKNKPIPRGLVHPREALSAGIALMIIMVLLLLFVNLPALLVSLLYLIFGQSYNLGLKSTPFSGILFALAIPLIPVYAFVGVGNFLPIIYWLVPVGALLGVTLNLANSLPDIERDATTNARTLAVVLGVRNTFIICPLLLLLVIALIIVLSITGLVPTQFWIMTATLLTVILLLVAALFLSSSRRPVATRKIYFYLVVVMCLLLGGGWIVATLLS